MIKDPLKFEAKQKNSTSSSFRPILLCTFTPNIGTIGWKLRELIRIGKKLTDAGRLYRINSALQPELQQPQCWSLTHAFLVVYWLRWYLLLEIIRIFKQGTVAQYCFLTGTLHQCHIIRLLQINFMNAIIARNRRIQGETGLSGVDHNIRYHPYSSSIVKHQEFDDQRGLFYKKSLHFGIKNLERYLRMNTDSKW